MPTEAEPDSPLSLSKAVSLANENSFQATATEGSLPLRQLPEPTLGQTVSIRFQEAPATDQIVMSPSFTPLNGGRPRQRRVCCGSVALPFVACIRRVCRRRVHDQTAVYSSDRMKPTTRLIVIVVTLSFVMTLVLAGIGIGVSWQMSMAQEQHTLLREQQRTLDSIET